MPRRPKRALGDGRARSGSARPPGGLRARAFWSRRRPRGLPQRSRERRGVDSAFRQGRDQRSHRGRRRSWSSPWNLGKRAPAARLQHRTHAPRRRAPTADPAQTRVGASSRRPGGPGPATGAAASGRATTTKPSFIRSNAGWNADFVKAQRLLCHHGTNRRRLLHARHRRRAAMTEEHGVEPCAVVAGAQGAARRQRRVQTAVCRCALPMSAPFPRDAR